MTIQFINSAQRSTSQVRTGVGAVGSILSDSQANVFSSAQTQTTKLAAFCLSICGQ